MCYVGMTRAERWLFLTGAWQRRLYGTEQQQMPSMFLQDIPVTCLANHTPQPEVASRVERRPEPRPYAASRRVRPQPSAPAGTFAEGRIVQHQQFGRGVIQKCEGDGETLKLTIVFSDHGIKKIMPKYASMQVV